MIFSHSVTQSKLSSVKEKRNAIWHQNQNIKHQVLHMDLFTEVSISQALGILSKQVVRLLVYAVTQYVLSDYDVSEVILFEYYIFNWFVLFFVWSSMLWLVTQCILKCNIVPFLQKEAVYMLIKRVIVRGKTFESWNCPSCGLRDRWSYMLFKDSETCSVGIICTIKRLITLE